MIKVITIGIVSIISTLLVYWGARRLNRKFSHPLTLPIVSSSIVIVLFLVIAGISYETYSIGGQWIEKLLGPAVVALAYPLYKQRQMVKTYAVPLIIGVGVGSIVGMSSGLLLSYWAGFANDIVLSMMPKSITTPVALEITNTTGGIPSLTAVFVVIAGVLGAVFHSYIFSKLNASHFLGRGVGMGSASHAIGTARSMETSEQEGVISTVAMTISAIIVSLFASVFVLFL